MKKAEKERDVARLKKIEKLEERNKIIREELCSYKEKYSLLRKNVQKLIKTSDNLIELIVNSNEYKFGDIFYVSDDNSIHKIKVHSLYGKSIVIKAVKNFEPKTYMVKVENLNDEEIFSVRGYFTTLEKALRYRRKQLEKIIDFARELEKSCQKKIDYEKEFENKFKEI